MQFKIDTKDTFSIVSPIPATPGAKLTDGLYQMVQEIRQSGSNNLIFDLSQFQEVEGGVLDSLVRLHEESYSDCHSLVFTGLHQSLIAALRAKELHLLLNIAPTHQEAIDIVSMEILERDLFNEE